MASFFSFHYDRDFARVQQVLNMGAIEGQTIVSGQDWEKVKREGNQAVRNWIAAQMRGKDAVVVLVGNQTSSREWVRYEIDKAWTDGIPLLGIRIHGLKNLDGKTDTPGANPFSTFRDSASKKLLSDTVPLFEPTGTDSKAVYDSIRSHVDTWLASGATRS